MLTANAVQPGLAADWVCMFLLQASKDPMVVEKIMNDLDENQDGEVDFQEFVLLVAALTVACNEFFEDCDRSSCAD